MCGRLEGVHFADHGAIRSLTSCHGGIAHEGVRPSMSIEVQLRCMPRWGQLPNVAQRHPR